MPKLSSTAILKDYNKTVGTNKDKLSAIDNVLIGVNNKYIFICTGKVNKEKADITILEKYKICDINVKENMLFSILETPRRKYILPRGLTKKLQLEKAKNMISKI